MQNLKTLLLKITLPNDIQQHIKKNRIPFDRVYPKDSRLTDLGGKAYIIISTCAKRAVNKILLLSDVKDNTLHYKIKNKQNEQARKIYNS